MTPNTLLKDKRDEVLRIAAAHGALHVRVFGSVARGEAGPKSDIDILVKLESGRSLLDIVRNQARPGRFIRMRSRRGDGGWSEPLRSRTGFKGSCQPVKGDRLYLKHILEAIDKVESYISTGPDIFFSTSHWQDAVIRQLEIIGEATKRLCRGRVSINGILGQMVQHRVNLRFTAVAHVAQQPIKFREHRFAFVAFRLGREYSKLSFKTHYLGV